ncbi:uncharacterized protein LOC116018718 [Ipomoea triloba]|uniref:uncharacterized protein LOC116018718 n=2 Tax=Ipomoea triloba TaxID=35885 RepID=UPI00125D3BEA|nr:uncharacterized protein LOC116018718 [Ipomoea triloba]
MLMAICPKLYEIYWFDSTGNPPRDDIKDIVETSLKATSIIGGKKASRQVKWITCSCAIQRGGTECGYYVMKFILEIISLGTCKGMNKLLERQGRLPYNQKEIDEVRDIWCQYLVDEWIDRLLL